MFDSRWFKQACLIGGEWRAAQGGREIEVTDPATGERVGAVPDFGAGETREAIAAAHAAFPAWRAKTAAERAAILHRFADLILADADALGLLLTTEQGKPLAEAKGEVASSANVIRWFAEEARRIYGDTIPSPWPDRRILVLREPVGVVGAITPWNFPSSMLARKIGAALATGCTVVAKPAAQTPFSALALGALALEAGVPAGVFNLVTGHDAAAIGDELCANPKVAKITFTGSTAVGKSLASKAMANMKRVSMELGGNAPFIVFDDADVEKAAAAAIPSKFRNAGQTCVCANRILVQAGAHDRFVDALATEMGKQKLGRGTEAGVTLGPLIEERAIAKVEAHIADAVAHGGRVVKGGGRSELGGTFFDPTLVVGATAQMKVATEETFGPLAAIFRFETEAEALAMANATEYGLAAYVFTRDLGRAFRMMEGLQYGQVGINEGLITTEVAPFGGYKDSGVGREGSHYGVEDYLHIKYACIGGLGG